jgi:hypothetical protein
VRPFPSLLRDDPPAGLAPPDLLQFVRVYVVVQGAQEAAVVGTLLGDRLDEIGAKIVAVGGLRRLNPDLDSQLIFDFTLANVVIIVPDARSDDLRAAWHEVGSTSGASRDSALDKLWELTRSGSSEEQLLGQFCRRAAQRGQDGRIDLFAFRRHDIIEYLPVTEFAPVADWETVEKGWPRVIPLREWVRDEYNAMTNAERLAEIASRLDSIPQDFLELARVCAEKAARVNWRTVKRTRPRDWAQ